MKFLNFSITIFSVHGAQFKKELEELAKLVNIVPHPNHLVTLLAVEKFIEQSIVNAVEPMETDGKDASDQVFPRTPSHSPPTLLCEFWIFAWWEFHTGKKKSKKFLMKLLLKSRIFCSKIEICTVILVQNWEEGGVWYFFGNFFHFSWKFFRFGGGIFTHFLRFFPPQRLNATNFQFFQGKSFALNRFDLGVRSSGNQKVDLAVRALRLIHVHRLRELQTQINELMVRIQKLTANPKADLKLGRVGF